MSLLAEQPKIRLEPAYVRVPTACENVLRAQTCTDLKGWLQVGYRCLGCEPNRLNLVDEEPSRLQALLDGAYHRLVADDRNHRVGRHWWPDPHPNGIEPPRDSGVDQLKRPSFDNGQVREG